MPIVDLRFRVLGNTIPVDHGYLLLSAVSQWIPKIHEDRDIGIHPIVGRLVGNRQLALTPSSRLVVRLSSDQISEILPLAGKSLRIGDSVVRVGIPEIHPLIASARLFSRVVLIKGFTEPQSFLGAVSRQLEKLSITAHASLVEQSQIARANAGKTAGSHSDVLRRTVRIHGRDIVGFAVRVEELTAEESLRLQEKGVGGRRKLGCGIFVPERRGL